LTIKSKAKKPQNDLGLFYFFKDKDALFKKLCMLFKRAYFFKDRDVFNLIKRGGVSFFEAHKRTKCEN